MRCKASILGAKEYYEDNEGRYYEERDEAFLQHIMDQVKSYLDGKENVSIDEFCEEVEDFDFPDIDKWLGDEYEGMLGDCADQAYEEYRDRQMGLD